MKPLICTLSVLLITPLQAFAEDWVVRKNNGNANCYVQLASALATPPPSVISTHPDRKAACEAVKALGADDVTENKCTAFTPNTITECKKEEVELP